MTGRPTRAAAPSGRGALGRLPPQAVVPLGARRPAELERQARRAGHLWLQADCSGARDKAGVMAALGVGLGLPDFFGANLDALYDCLTDLDPSGAPDGSADPGIAIVVVGLPRGPGFDAAQLDALLDVFRDAAEWFADRPAAFRVLWSLRDARSEP
jgi:RNAse (barnase) inhibitor barstar